MKPFAKTLKVLCLLAVYFGVTKAKAAPSISVVPTPQAVELRKGSFEFQEDSHIVVFASSNAQLIRQARVLSESLRRLTGRSLQVVISGQVRDGSILLQLDRSKQAEGYSLDVRENFIRLRAGSLVGLNQAASTLLQLVGAASEGKVPQVKIVDAPDCDFRAFMVDLGRNRHSLQALKQTVDMLWLYKVRYLHLHLTDDQRFAFPSIAFPKLHQGSPDFTLEELKELQDYAAARSVTIIPELDVPGHSTKLREHYPEVFGKSATELATLPTSRAAVKTLIDEMLAVFGSTPYFHIGGDEAGGVPEDMQRDFINELNRHLRGRGKTTLVWEGPRLGEGEKKVDTDVVQMNWDTINFPADQMLQAGYKVINAAWDPLYVVDHYPRNNFTMASPQHIYEQLSRWRFKHFNPDVRTFAEPIVVPEDSQVIGFCMPWWEGREENYLRLCRPRLAAMAARAWNPAAKKDYAEFVRRDARCAKTLQLLSAPVTIKAAPLAIESAGVFHNQTEVKLKKTIPGEIYFTLDSSVPNEQSTKYTQPIVCEETCRIRAVLVHDNKQVGHVSELMLTCVKPIANLALGKPVTSSAASDPIFGVERLTDGGTGNLDFYLGYPAQPEPITIVVDLEEAVMLNEVAVHEYTSGKSYEDYRVAISVDGKTYTQIGESAPGKKEAGAIVYKFERTEARYLRIETSGHLGQVFSSFSRLTEIQAFDR